MVRPPSESRATASATATVVPLNTGSWGVPSESHPVRSILSIIWALIPAITVGFLTSPCLLYASIRLRSRRIGMFAAFYFALTATVVLLVWNQPTGSSRTNAATLISFLSAIAGTLQCFALRSQVVTGERRVQSIWRLDKNPDKHVFRGSRRSRVKGGGEVLVGSSLCAGFFIGPTSSWNLLGDILLPTGAALISLGFMSLTAKVVVSPRRIRSVWRFRTRSTPIERVRAIDTAQKWMDGKMIWIPLVILDDRSERPLTALALPLSSDSSRQNVREVVQTLRTLTGVGGIDRT